MSQEELIKYRIARANETLKEARLLADAGYWNAAANRLYYACFYLVNALLISRKLSFNSHNGVKTEFNRTFVKSGLVSMESGKCYARVFNLRQEGDYIDFKRFEKQDIDPFFEEVQAFFKEVTPLITLE
ncbi:MAG: HEPN domain-containing protein [Bacteroidales bacterium]|nr:HEPN domain-containing protein [Bacteroidales bacterium]